MWSECLARLVTFGRSFRRWQSEPDGKFKVAVPPGCPYGKRADVRGFRTDFTRDVTVEPGETIDVGEVKLQKNGDGDKCLPTPGRQAILRRSPLAAPIVSPQEGVGPQNASHQRAWAPLCHQLMRLLRHPDSGSRERSASAQGLDLLLALRPLRAQRSCDEQRAQCRFWSGDGKRHRTEKCGVKTGAVSRDIRETQERESACVVPHARAFMLSRASVSPLDGVCKSTSPCMVSTPAAFRCTRCHDRRRVVPLQNRSGDGHPHALGRSLE